VRGLEGPPASYEERTGALIRRASSPVGLDRSSLERVWGRLEAGAGGRRRPSLGTVLRLSAAVAILLVSGAVVGAETGVWTWPRAIVHSLARRAPEPDGARRELTSRAPARKSALVTPTHIPSAPAEPALPAPSAAGEAPPAPGQVARPTPASARGARASVPPLPVRPSPHAAEAPDTTPPPVAAGPGSTLAAESAVLGRALTQLRQRHDAVAALAELDRYGTNFPSGLLSAEAERTRVDALLLAGRLSEAREILARLTLGSGGRDLELRVLRAELTAGTTSNARGSCVAALRDYEVALAERSSGALAERALWGRAACKARLGDRAGARADLRDYLVRFPTGAHAAMATARLRDGGGDAPPGAAE
jgi:hypothetical protein